MIKINSALEKISFFSSTIQGQGAYFNVKYPDGSTELIWVSKFANFNEDGSDYFLEAPNFLRKFDFKPEFLEPYYDSEEDEWFDSPYSYMYIDGDYAFEIEAPQTGPFLPISFKIEYITSDYKEATKYLLNTPEYKNL